MQANRRPRAPGSKGAPASGRRTRVEGERNHHLYTRTGGALEVGYRDSAGKQRWKTLPPDTTITQARGERDSILAAKSRGEVVRPTPRLRFGDALDRWLSDQVTDLRPNTQAMYRNAAHNHLRPRWGNRRMDTLDVDDAARLVRDLRDRGLADSTIHGILVAASRVMKFARRRMRWNGENVVAGLDSSERPQTSGRPRRRIFTLAELAQTLRAAEEPWRTMFALDAVTGARQSEVLGLIWSDFDLGDVDDAIVRFTHQLSRSGERAAEDLRLRGNRRTATQDGADDVGASRAVAPQP